MGLRGTRYTWDGSSPGLLDFCSWEVPQLQAMTRDSLP